MEINLNGKTLFCGLCFYVCTHVILAAELLDGSHTNLDGRDDFSIRMHKLESQGPIVVLELDRIFC
jgi:hypothetical protein